MYTHTGSRGGARARTHTHTHTHTQSAYVSIRDVSNGKRAPDGPGSDNANFLGEVRIL
jgi:hypothetical protein